MRVPKGIQSSGETSHLHQSDTVKCRRSGLFRRHRYLPEFLYCSLCQNGRVFLVQRARDASLMAGMWELPEVANRNGESNPLFTLRHSITVTDYTVRVMQGQPDGAKNGRWISKSRVTNLALTGLARKILRAAGII